MTPAELSARGIRVKPLVWVAIGAGWHLASCIDDSDDPYTVTSEPDGYRLMGGGAFFKTGPFKTLPLAKAAAQAHHDARVADQLEFTEGME